MCKNAQLQAHVFPKTQRKSILFSRAANASFPYALFIYFFLGGFSFCFSFFIAILTRPEISFFRDGKNEPFFLSPVYSIRNFFFLISKTQVNVDVKTRETRMNGKVPSAKHHVLEISDVRFSGDVFFSVCAFAFSRDVSCLR